MPITIVNSIISITFHSLALFVSEYLRTNRSKQAIEESHTPEKLGKSILFCSTRRSDGSIDWRPENCSKTERKELNCLGYKWEEV